MAKIIDPDDLTQDTEITINEASRLIELTKTGNLSDDGVTLQCIYSFLKEEWKSDATLIKYPFPLVAITEEQFELTATWDWADKDTRDLIRDGGWALKNTSGVSQEEYMNVTTLGAFDDENVDNAYYLQVDGSSTTSTMVLTGPTNQAVKVYGDASHGDFDYRDFFQIFLREEQKKYDSYDLPTAQNLSALTYKKYAMPLANGGDVKVIASDSTIEASALYTNIDVTYHTEATYRDIGASSFPFDVIIEGDIKDAEKIYEKVQYQLRNATDIDESASVKWGTTADELLEFIGDTLRTKTGVFIDNFKSADTNRLEFTDTNGVVQTYPYVAAGNLLFNDNLKNDSNAKYWMFFTDVGGSNYGDSDAIIVNDNNGSPITGNVGGVSELEFDFDYDGNNQGGRTPGTDANVTVVALGLDTAQFFKTTAVILKSTANNITLVSALERNYSNPA